MIEFDNKGNPWDNCPEEIVVMEDFYDDNFAVSEELLDDNLAVSDGLFPKPAHIVLILALLCLAYWVYQRLSRRSEQARKHKKIDLSASKFSSIPSNTTGNGVVHSVKRGSGVSTLSPLSPDYSRPGTTIADFTVSDPRALATELNSEPLLISLGPSQLRKRAGPASPATSSMKTHRSTQALLALAPPYAVNVIVPNQRTLAHVAGP